MRISEYKCIEPVHHNGKKFSIDDAIELDDAAAERLIISGAVIGVFEGNPEDASGEANGESTAAEDALAEQADKNTNQDPETDNKDGGDATPSAPENTADGTNTQPEEATGEPAPAASDGAAGDGKVVALKPGKDKAKGK